MTVFFAHDTIHPYISARLGGIVMTAWQNMAERMVREQIAARGIRSEGVLKAMMSVPRHLFLPPSLEESAWIDSPLPIGEDQTISQPYIVAKMTELLSPEEGEEILEIGTGSGYQSAVLAAMGARVTSLERIRTLAESSGKALAGLGCAVKVLWSDGTEGGRPEGPFHGVLVTAAAPELEEWWSEVLLPGGRLVVPLSVASGGQRMLLRVKIRGKNYDDTWHDYCRFVPLLKGRRGQETEE